MSGFWYLEIRGFRFFFYGFSLGAGDKVKFCVESAFFFGGKVLGAFVRFIMEEFVFGLVIIRVILIFYFIYVFMVGLF